MSSLYSSSRLALNSKRALNVALAVSLAAHFWVGPWRSWLGMVNFDDSVVLDKPLELPMELSVEEQSTAPPPQETVEEQAPPAPQPTIKKPAVIRDAGPPQEARDAGPPMEAGARYAEANDAGLPPGLPGSAAPARGENEVDLIVNMGVIRKHPDGPRLGALLTKLPVWNIMQGTGVDPVRDFEAVRVYGPSVWMTRAPRLAVDVRYTASDSAIDLAARAVSAKRPAKGAWSFSSPTVHAYSANILGSDVVLLRGKSHTLSIVKPPADAEKFAAYMEKSARDVPMWADQAVWARVKDPHGQVSQFPKGAELLEVRLETTPDSGGKLVLHLVGNTAQDARDLAEAFSTYGGMYSLYAVQTPELPADLLSRAQVQISGRELDITVRMSGPELHRVVDYVLNFCERRGCN